MIIQGLCEHYRTADKEGSLPIFSANLVAVPPLYAVTNCVLKHFLNIPQYQTMSVRK